MNLKNLLSLVAASVISSSAFAQGWDKPSISGSSDPESGSKYYIMNVEAGKFMTGMATTHTWATTCGLSNDGLLVTLTDTGEGWTIQRSDNKYTFRSGADECHVDMASQGHYHFDFTQLSNGYYTIANNADDETYGGKDEFWGYQPNAAVPTHIYCNSTEDAPDTYIEWAFVSEEEFAIFSLRQKIHDVGTAVEDEYPSLNLADERAVYDNYSSTKSDLEDVLASIMAKKQAKDIENGEYTSYIVNPEVNGLTGWTTSKENGNGPTLGDRAFEYWSYTLGKGKFDYYQDITGLPNGKYKVSADMMNDQASSAAAFVPSAGLYAQSGAVKTWALVDWYADGDGEGAMSTYETEEVVVTNGTLRIGVSCKTPDNMPARWFVADNFKLTFIEGINLQDYYDQIEALLNEANGLVGKQSVAVTEALQGAVTGANGYESVTDIDALQTIADNLSEAIANSNASIEAYSALQDALAKPYFADRSDVFGSEFTYLAEAKAMYNDATASTDDAKAKADGMLGAYRAYVREIAAEYTPLSGVADARTKASWEYTTNPQNNATFNNNGNMDITANTMWENWRGAGLTEGDMKQTVTGLANGKYFLKMVSFTRNSPNENDYIYIKSGSAEAQAISLGEAATSNGFINITDPIEVTNGEVEIGLHVGSGCDWAAIGGVALYKYADAATMAVNAEAQYGTFCAPFDVTVPAGVTASTATLDGSTVVLASVGETIPANTPVVLEGALDATIVYGKAVAGTPVAGVLTGVYAITQAPIGSYVLQNQNDKVAFYLVNSEITVPANRAYLTATSGAKVLNFPAATAINALTTGTVEAIYNANGVKQNKLQKGMNIIVVNGQTQKVLVK